MDSGKSITFSDRITKCDLENWLELQINEPVESISAEGNSVNLLNWLAKK